MLNTYFNCLFCRITGSLLLCTCLFTAALTIRFFFRRHRRYRKGLAILPLSPILIGMLISIMLILSTGFPLALIQCFTCRPLQLHPTICRLNGFICFAVGTFNMYLLVLLSLCRYFNIVYKSNSSGCHFERYRGLSVIISALISLCWALPPLLNTGNTYINEDLGFHCSFDWNNSAFQSRLFLYSLVICNYFLLLFILIYSNLRIYFVLRRLLKSDQSCGSSLISAILPVSVGNASSAPNLQLNLRKDISDRQLKRKLSRLQRLKMDQRYARIIAIMTSQFICGWTPYAILAMIIIHDGIESIRRYPFFAILSELLAKFALIFNPLILIYTNKMRYH